MIWTILLVVGLAILLMIGLFMFGLVGLGAVVILGLVALVAALLGFIEGGADEILDALGLEIATEALHMLAVVGL